MLVNVKQNTKTDFKLILIKNFKILNIQESVFYFIELKH